MAMTATSKIDELLTHWREVGPVAWAEGAFGWIGMDGQPIKLEPWQAAALNAWWEHRETVTTFAISNIKKTGKTFLNAVLLAWRWLALPGEHFAVGNDLDQSAGRQFQQIAEMVKHNPYLSQNCKVTGKAITFEPTGSTITALPVDAAGNAGANHLTASHTEAWGIVYEQGIRAFEELTPPPGSFYGLPALRICDSYAGFEGESGTWHTLVDRGLKGERIDKEWPIFLAGGMLLFHIDGLEAQWICFRGSAEQAKVYYEDQRATLRPGTFDRLHLNKRATGAEAFIELIDWDACTDPEYAPVLTGSRIFVGVDGSIKHDTAAVVATTYNRETGKVDLVQYRIFKPTPSDPLDIDGALGGYIRELAQRHKVVTVRFDPYQLVDLSQRLRSEGVRMEEYPQTVANLTAMGQNLYELIKGKNIRFYPASDMRAQASHAVALQSSRGWRIAKEKSALKIDSIVALAMSAIAAVDGGMRYDPKSLIGYA